MGSVYAIMAANRSLASRQLYRELLGLGHSIFFHSVYSTDNRNSQELVFHKAEGIYTESEVRFSDDSRPAGVRWQSARDPE